MPRTDDKELRGWDGSILNPPTPEKEAKTKKAKAQQERKAEKRPEQAPPWPSICPMCGVNPAPPKPDYSEYASRTYICGQCSSRQRAEIPMREAEILALRKIRQRREIEAMEVMSGDELKEHLSREAVKRLTALFPERMKEH